jgi:hypothetical protein
VIRAGRNDDLVAARRRVDRALDRPIIGRDAELLAIGERRHERHQKQQSPEHREMVLQRSHR